MTAERDEIFAAVDVKRSQRPNGRDQCCENCVFWEPRALFFGEKNTYGECHRHAPNAAHFVLGRMGQAIAAVQWATEETANIKHEDRQDYDFETEDIHWICWPIVDASEWCGDFVARHEPLELLERKGAA